MLRPRHDAVWLRTKAPNSVEGYRAAARAVFAEMFGAPDPPAVTGPVKRWYMVLDGKEWGPFDDDERQQLIDTVPKGGRPEVLVWREATPAIEAASCECSSAFVDPRCTHHGAHEYHGPPDA